MPGTGLPIAVVGQEGFEEPVDLVHGRRAALVRFQSNDRVVGSPRGLDSITAPPSVARHCVLPHIQDMKWTALIPILALSMLLAPAHAENPTDALAAGIAAYEAEEYERAREYLAPLAMDGVPRALYLMGDMHWAGRGGAQDFAAALDHLTRAADGAATAEPQEPFTYREAVHRIGYLYRFGQGVVQSDAIAECLYRIGAEMGNANSQWNLSRVIREHPGIDEETILWLQRAAKQGHPKALANLGFIMAINPLDDRVEGLVMLLVARELGSDFAAEKLQEFEGLVFDGLVDDLFTARERKWRWRAVPEAPPTAFTAIHLSCV
jgi:hypothetical protein